MSSNTTAVERSHWRYLWDSNRLRSEDYDINIHEQLEFQGEPLPEGYDY